MNISERINKLMKKHRLSRYTLAKISKVPYTTLIKVLDGTTKNPQIETLNSIAEALKVSVDDLSNPWVVELIEEGLKQTGMTLEELSEQTKIPLKNLQNIDSLTPAPWDYESGGIIDRIAKVLKLNSRELAAAFARQEPPAYDAPRISIEEVFSYAFDEKHDTSTLREEVSAYEDVDKVLKPSGKSSLDMVPEWATSKDIRDFKKMLESDVPIMFDGVPIEGEARQRVMDVLTGLFWEAKEMNKKTYGRKKDNKTDTSEDNKE